MWGPAHSFVKQKFRREPVNATQVFQSENSVLYIDYLHEIIDLIHDYLLFIPRENLHLFGCTWLGWVKAPGYQPFSPEA